MHQVEVDVVQLQGSKALLASYLNQGLLMECVPQLWEETKPPTVTSQLPQGRPRDRNFPLGGLAGQLPPHAEGEDVTFHCWAGQTYTKPAVMKVESGSPLTKRYFQI